MAEKGQGNIIQVHLAQYNPVPSVEDTDRKGWITYGNENNYPHYLTSLYSSCPVHGTLTKSIIRMIAGKGLQSSALAELQRIGADKAVPKMAYDLKIQGGYYLEIIYKKGGDIDKITCLEFSKCRLGVQKTEDDGELLCGIWFSEDWTATRKRCNTPRFIPKFNPTPTDDPTQRESYREAYWFFMDKGTNRHYPQPDYENSLTWIDCERQIGLFHINNLYNGLFPAFIINFMNGQPDLETKQEMKRDWENKLGGAGNAGKFIMTFNESGKDAPQITTFPISDADKQYQFLSSEATSKVMIGHRVTTPLLFGIRSEGGGLGSNTDEMKTGLKIFMSDVIEPFQRDICDGLEEILKAQGITTEITIIPNTPIDTEAVTDKPEADAPGAVVDPSAPPAEDVASQALNGAQIESLINIVIQASTGAVPVDTCRAIVQAGFPMLTEDQINNIFKSVNPGSLDTTEVIQSKIRRAVLSALKKKPELSEDIEAALLEKLDTLAEDPGDEWELLSEEEAAHEWSSEDSCIEEIENRLVQQANEGSYANGDEKSKFGDKGLYKLRYRYSQDLSADSRQFCKRMVALSLAGKVFRYEDIKAMGNDGVNGQFAPAGESTYNIFEWKGGVYCHHHWVRQIYFRKRKDGKFLPNDGLKNDVLVGNNPYVPKKGKEAIAPINTPSRGSLKNS